MTRTRILLLLDTICDCCQYIFFFFVFIPIFIVKFNVYFSHWFKGEKKKKDLMEMGKFCSACRVLCSTPISALVFLIVKLLYQHY